MPYKAFKRKGKFAVHKLDADGKPTGEAMGMHDTTEDAMKQVAALYAKEPKTESERIEEREFSTERREELAGKGAAMKDGSFPIVNRVDLLNAVKAIGRASNRAAVMAHIKKRARALGLTDLLPEDWRESANRVTYIRDLIDLRESDMDEAEFIARGVTLIRPGFSTNKDGAGRPRYYPRETLAEAAQIFEGTRSFANHPGRVSEKDLPERDVRDLTGYFENVRLADSGALQADFRVVGQARQWLWPMILETQRKPDYVQLSINALGSQRIGEAEGKPAVIVESILSSNSVDTVTSGAAGGGFTGALLASDGDEFMRALLAAMPFEQWYEARPEFLERLKNEMKAVRDDKFTKSLRLDLQEAQTEIERLKEQHRAERDELMRLRRGALADRLLSESALPYKLRETIRPELLDQEEAGMKELVARAAKLHQGAPRIPVPVGGAGQRTVTTVETQKPSTPPLLEAMGIPDTRLVPRDHETPEAWAARVKQLRG
jgi:hypothetical protein